MAAASCERAGSNKNGNVFMANGGGWSYLGGEIKDDNSKICLVTSVGDSHNNAPQTVHGEYSYSG